MLEKNQQVEMAQIDPLSVDTASYDYTGLSSGNKANFHFCQVSGILQQEHGHVN